MNTGRSNPELELGGSDYLRGLGVWSDSVSGEVILNTARARGQETAVEFEPILGLKLDYVQESWTASVIGALEQHGRQSVGWHGTATLGDATLVYAEGSVSRRNRGLYPVLPGAVRGAFAMQPLHDDDDSAQLAAVLGLAYTFAFGTTLTAEYMFNGEGYDDKAAREYNEVLKRAAGALQDPSGSRFGTQTFMAALAPGQRTLRQNYLNVQIGHLNFEDQADLFLRYTHNFDDQSGLVTPIIQWNVADKVRLFAIASITTGSEEDEYGGLFRYQGMTGFRYFLL